MVVLKTSREISAMGEAGQIAANALHIAGQHCISGTTTKELDTIIKDYIRSMGATPSFFGYNGFPASACISVNDEVIHGIPNNKTVLKDGDVVSIDVGAYYKGFHGDTAYTFQVGDVSKETKKLLDITRLCLTKAIECVKPGARIGDISHTIEMIAKQNNYGIVRQFVGHGVGQNLHEAPEVPNFGTQGRGVRLVAGMTLAIEPMINIKGDDVYVLADGWTVKTKSRGISAHFEHTVAVTPNGSEILTIPTIKGAYKCT